MKVPFDVFKMYLPNIVADKMGGMQPIMPFIVLYCRGTIHPHVQYNPKLNPQY